MAQSQPREPGARGAFERLDLSRGRGAVWAWLKASAPALGANALAGLVASLLTLAYCVSFSALLFQGPLAGGLPMGLWALLVGSAIAGLYVALTTSLPPAEAGPDNPAVAVLAVLAATVSGSVLAAGGDARLAVDVVLLAFSLATLVTGIVLYLLGRLKLGGMVRFIPYPVIAGFLAASGWFLIVGGFEVMTGRDITLATITEAVPRERVSIVALGAMFALAIFAAKMISGSMYVLPVAFLAGTVVLDIVLWWAGVAREGSGWFIGSATRLEPWVPLRALFTDGVDASLFLGATTEIAAVAGVTVIALLLDITGLEVSRAKSADLDWEFRTNGAANILAAPLGGIMGNLSLNGSRLLEETGGFARASGVVASIVVVLVVITGIDLPGLVPAPVLAGLLIYLGLVVLTEVLVRSPAHRAWTDFGLALVIMAAIVIQGYLAGIMFGVIAACLMFAVNYGRISVIRRHLTRSVVASNMDRSALCSRHLQEHGERIHVFWLAGYIFFGSSNGLYEKLVGAMAADNGGGRRRFAILDFGDVTGFDTSAVMSLRKLANYAETHDVALVLAGLSPRMANALARVGVIASERDATVFRSRNDALEWCEDQILAERDVRADADADADFEHWLAAEVGSLEAARKLARYFERRDIDSGTVLFTQGSPSQSIDLIVSGTVSVTVRGGEGNAHVVRRMSTRTVVGEMGFFRGLPRGATIAAEDAATLYTLSAERFLLLKKEQPEIAAAFLEFIVRALSDRLAFANQGLAALS
ncbi:MAG TPA: SulP family inorganic anion transporter [Hyphomicrobium sp.]|nr:SulP family inorganic anion transporter [Hyphomicrobium sp.]